MYLIFVTKTIVFNYYCIFILYAGVIHCIAASVDGQVMCSTGEDKALKVFDVVNFGKN